VANGMICELCGKEVPETRSTWIEGAQMKVCKDCQRFGDKPKAGAKESPTKVVIASRLEQRERRMRTRDIYKEEEVFELVDDYATRIRDARNARGWKTEQLAAKISEKASTLSKVESGHLKPDDVLVAKLEKELNIVLIEKVPLVKPEAKSAKHGGGMTIEQFIKHEKKKE
jgi:putative transcription factor